jgi:hypothetical protein
MTRGRKRREEIKAAKRLVGWWKRRKLSSLSPNLSGFAPMVIDLPVFNLEEAVLDRVTGKTIPPYAPRVKHVDAAGDVAYFEPGILEEYVAGTGTFKLDGHVFSEAQLNTGLGDGAYARLLAKTALVPVNTEDPFTMELPVEPTYRHVTQSATGSLSACVFSVGELVNYFRKTGKFKNPFSNDEFTESQIAVIGYLAHDLELVSDIPRLNTLRTQIAQEESLLDFLQSEVDMCFDDMLHAAQLTADDVVMRVPVNDIVLDLLDIYSELVQHLLNLEARSVERCAVAHSNAGAKLKAVSSNPAHSHSQKLLYNVVETCLDAWKAVEDLTPDTTPRAYKLEQLAVTHKALLLSLQ